MGGVVAMQLIINMRHVFIHDKKQKISKHDVDNENVNTRTNVKSESVILTFTFYIFQIQSSGRTALYCRKAGDFEPPRDCEGINFYYKQMKHPIGQANEYHIMHYFRISRHTQSMIAYRILTKYFWKFQ